ncbi:MAG: xanthine dehydrogenase family protein subunit M [Betaproteobacteria bacterium]|nr:xanthine dehydrogenase family protein subunit M [Betaproteobacteria bacterium]
MKPAPFRYHSPGTLDEALALLAEHGAGAKVLAGGQSLGPMMNMRLAQPDALVDINAIAGLDYVREHEKTIEIGALTRHHAIATSPLVRAACPLLAEAARQIGHYAIRQRGTIGGSLAHADPAAQFPLACATLGAEITAAGAGRTRTIAASEFFLSLMSTALEPEEIIVSVTLPKAPTSEGQAYVQFSRRRGDFAIVALAATVRPDAGGHIDQVRLGVGGATDRPMVLAELADCTRGEKADSGWAARLAKAAYDAVAPIDTPRVPAEFRRELVHVLTRRVLVTALERARR